MSTVRLTAVGDIALGEHPLCLGIGIDTAVRRHGPAAVFAGVREALGADIVFGNLENMLLDPVAPAKRLDERCLRGSPSCAAALAEAGVNVLSLANNHALQYGRAGLDATRSLLEGHGIEGIGVTGRPLLVKHCRGLHIGFSAYCQNQQYELQQTFVEPIEAGAIERDIQALRAMGAQVIVVSLHWGDEFVPRPSTAQVRLARAIIRSGANLVLGHHPHVLQGVERHEGGLIAYSLGTFIGDVRWDPELTEGVILRCDLTPDGVGDFELLPTTLTEAFRPEVATGRPAADIRHRLEGLCADLAHAGVGDIGAYDAAYQQTLRARRARNRRQMYRHFLSHLAHYPAAVRRELFDSLVLRRLSRLLWPHSNTPVNSGTTR